MPPVDRLKLRQATTAERNAAFDVVHREVTALINQLPGFIQGQARQKLESKEGYDLVFKIIDEAFEAAEAVREAGEVKTT